MRALSTQRCEEAPHMAGVKAKGITTTTTTTTTTTYYIIKLVRVSRVRFG